MKIYHEGVIITSKDTRATEDIAKQIASVLSKFWLKGYVGKPIVVMIEDCRYEAEEVKVQ